MLLLATVNNIIVAFFNVLCIGRSRYFCEFYLVQSHELHLERYGRCKHYRSVPNPPNSDNFLTFRCRWSNRKPARRRPTETQVRPRLDADAAEEPGRGAVAVLGVGGGAAAESEVHFHLSSTPFQFTFSLSRFHPSPEIMSNKCVAD
jgi:hypothetical protein